MAHLDYSESFNRGRIGALASAMTRLTKDWFIARAKRHAEIQRQWEDREAFRNLLDKEEWVYRDMGIHRGDVEYLANQPLHVNASRELEKIKRANMLGR